MFGTPKTIRTNDLQANDWGAVPQAGYHVGTYPRPCRCCVSLGESGGQIDRLVKAQNSHDRLVDAPDLFVGQMTSELAQPLDVHGTELFYQHS
jgi:hypothetical protein